jgi:hypothetical protein
VDQVILIPDPLPLANYGFDGVEFYNRAHIFFELLKVGLPRMAEIMDTVVDLETVKEAGKC